MKKKDHKIIEENIKTFFSKVGLESPSEDFTSSVLKQIEIMPIKAAKRKINLSKYHILVFYFVTVLLVIPFIPYLINWIFSLNIESPLYSFSIIRDWITGLRSFFNSLYFSTTFLIIIIASLITICLFAISNFFGMKHEFE